MKFMAFIQPSAIEIDGFVSVEIRAIKDGSVHVLKRMEVGSVEAAHNMISAAAEANNVEISIIDNSVNAASI